MILMRFRFFLAVLLLSLISLALLPQPVLANNEYERLPAGAVIESDYIRAAQSIQIDGEIHGDTFLTGGVVTINGKIDGDLFVVGGKVSVNGEVTNSIRVLAGDVTINGPVGRNVLLLCGNCTVTKQAVIGGSFLTAGGNLELSAARIGRGFRFFGSRLYVNSEIANEAFVVVDKQFLLGPLASISGNLKYTGEKQVEMEPGATVGGTIAYQNTSQNENYPGFFGIKPLFDLYQRLQPVVDLFGFVVTLLIGFILLGLFPRGFEKSVVAMQKQPYAALGWGLLTLIALPVVAVLFALTIVGLPVSGVLLLLGYIILLGAKFVAAFFIGRTLLLSRFGERRGWALFVGLLLIYLIGLIPLLGSAVKLFIQLFALGGMILAYRHPVILEPSNPAPIAISKKKRYTK